MCKITICATANCKTMTTKQICQTCQIVDFATRELPKAKEGSIAWINQRMKLGTLEPFL